MISCRLFQELLKWDKDPVVVKQANEHIMTAIPTPQPTFSAMKETYCLETPSTNGSEQEVDIADEFTAAFKHDLHRGLKSRQIAMV